MESLYSGFLSMGIRIIEGSILKKNTSLIECRQDKLRQQKKKKIIIIIINKNKDKENNNFGLNSLVSYILIICIWLIHKYLLLYLIFWGVFFLKKNIKKCKIVLHNLSISMYK